MFSTADYPLLNPLLQPWFHRAKGVALWPESGRLNLSSTMPTQGRLHLHTALRMKVIRCTALQVPNLFRTQAEIPQGSTSAHKNRSPRKQGHIIHAIEYRPGFASAKMRFPPAPTRNWAYQAGTRGFIVVPFGGFLGPPSEAAVLTRILRRRSAIKV